MLFVSPERLLNERFLSDLRCVPGGVSLAVVDEAHCVSEWSHNFRPAYHRLGRILRSRLQLHGPVLALSATATERTERHLRSQLCIPKDGAYRNDTIRPNLILAAMRVPGQLQGPHAAVHADEGAGVQRRVGHRVHRVSEPGGDGGFVPADQGRGRQGLPRGAATEGSRQDPGAVLRRQRAGGRRDGRPLAWASTSPTSAPWSTIASEVTRGVHPAGGTRR